MISATRRYNQTVDEMENAALALIRYAERFSSNISSTADRSNRSKEIFEAARRYAAAVRRVARLRL